jgi:endonuclease/exonuclease/phosphatase family metal-dependent hydrolase
MLLQRSVVVIVSAQDLAFTEQKWYICLAETLFSTFMHPMKFKLWVLFAFILVISSCEPLATSFEESEPAEYFEAVEKHPVPDTLTEITIMTWNIRFGAARLPWFGDACGDRVIFTEEEVIAALQGIVDKINEIDPDVLLLQEVDLLSKRSAYIDQMSWILERTSFNYAIYGSQWRSKYIPSDGLGRLDEGNAVFSRWKISDAERIQLPLREDQDAIVRYFYERCCMVRCKVEIPEFGPNGITAVNIHASAFATDDTKQIHIQKFKEELDGIANAGELFIAGGDLNTLPPGSDTTDYCIQDKCNYESYHMDGDDPEHKEGSNYTPEVSWMDGLYNDYSSAIPLAKYQASQYSYFTHTTRSGHFWDRTLDYLFTNSSWVENSGLVRQEALLLSDHAPVVARIHVPAIKSTKR